MMPKQPQKSHSTQTAKTPVMPPKKVYSREFKLETLRLLKSSGKTKADLEGELGLILVGSGCGKGHSIRKRGTCNKPSQAQVTRAKLTLK
jgi:hypothetical protein